MPSSIEKENPGLVELRTIVNALDSESKRMLIVEMMDKVTTAIAEKYKLNDLNSALITSVLRLLQELFTVGDENKCRQSCTEHGCKIGFFGEQLEFPESLGKITRDNIADELVRVLTEGSYFEKRLREIAGDKVTPTIDGRSEVPKSN